MGNMPVVKQSEVYDMVVNKGYERVVVPHIRYDVVYGEIHSKIVSIVKVVPHQGYELFKVGGTYHNRIPLIYNYFLSHTKKDAKQQYERLYGWKATECHDVSRSEARRILTDPNRAPL